MFIRKLFAAFYTIVLAFFIVPLLFDGFTGDYFMIGFVVSLYTAPTLIIVGIPISSYIESKFGNGLVGFSCLLLGGVVCGIIIGIIMMEEGLLLFAIIAALYTVIFYCFDRVSKNMEGNLFE